MFRVKLSRLTRSALVVMLLMLSGIAAASAGFGKSGWSIMRKPQTTEFRETVTPLISMKGGLSGIFYNPALLGAGTQREAFFISESGLADTVLGTVAYGEPVKGGMIAGALAYYDAGKIELNWMENGALKSENASAQRDMLGILSYGRKYGKKLYVGGALKGARSEIAQRASASAYAVDFGIVYVPAKNIPVSLAVQNIGYSTKFSEKENPLPASVYAGSGYLHKMKRSYMSFGAGANYNMVDEKILPEAGVELGYDIISMNVGYRFGMEESIWHVGFGVTWNDFKFGYAFVPGVYLDPTHRMSVGFKFGTKTYAKAATPAKKVVTKKKIR